MFLRRLLVCLSRFSWFRIETRAVTPFPWFLIPFFISGIPLTIIYMRFVYHEMRMWTYISAGISEFAFLMFLIWGFVNSSWPWYGRFSNPSLQTQVHHHLGHRLRRHLWCMVHSTQQDRRLRRSRRQHFRAQADA